MRCPTFAQLPPAPPGKTGWPWTEESLPLLDRQPCDSPWPRISIITPSFNQGRFIEETIRSVLLQGYPDLEYIIMDGDSNDGSADIIRKYSPWLNYWVSEPDRGQAHAINKGFSCATGALLAWINSDDLYLPGALKLFAEYHLRDPRKILMGDIEFFFEGEYRYRLIKQYNISFLNMALPEREPCSWNQQGLFVPTALSIAVGPLDEDLRYSFDVDWLLRLLQHAEVSYLHRAVARFRFHDSAKSSAQATAMMEECHHLLQSRYWKMIPDLDLSYAKALHSLQMAHIYLASNKEDKIHWNRATGLKQLMSACMNSPRVLIHPDFMKLCRRAVLPKWLLRSNPWQ